MYISYNWLKDFVKLPARIKPEMIAGELTNHTVEIEGIVNQADQFDKVVVGRVLEVRKHPNADRLRLTVVDIKTKKLNIVCGAPNVAVDQLVPVALVGAKLPGGLEIKESVIRGENSSGMICAEDELGLGKNHEGIMVLKEGAKVGEPFAKYLKADDLVFEVDNKSLSNRPDLLNHYGLARELSAIFDVAIKPYEKFIERKWPFLAAKESKFSVKVSENELCPRYIALKIDNIEVKESPTWLKDRLIAVGQRPINNIVDLSNYVMFDCGQPLHAFAADGIEKIIVRRAGKNEILETLDEKERTLDDNDLVISDGVKALAIAGIMGGRDSGVKAETKSLILESANFAAAGIRKTSQKLGLRTEASIRFEKALDPALAELAAFRFLTLLKEICPELTVASPLFDIDNSGRVLPQIKLDLDWLTKKIGQEIPGVSVSASLKKLGFTVTEETERSLIVTVPSWRATKDVSTREDLAEEILRLYGYDKIESKMPTLPMALPETNEERKLERKIKTLMAAKYSLNEAYNYSFVGEDQLRKMKIESGNYLRLVNPLAETQALLRQTLIPGLAGNIKSNQFKADSFGFFEIGSVYFNAVGNWRKDRSEEGRLPYQEKKIGLALAGGEDLFAEIKGIITSLLKNLAGEAEIKFLAPGNVPGWAADRVSAKIVFTGREIGFVAMISPEVSANLSLKKKAACAELDLSLIMSLVLGAPAYRFQEAVKYPPVWRDISFVVSEEILYNDLREAIINFDPLIKSADLFDVYVGNKLAAAQKSLAFRIMYQSAEKTLTAQEVDDIQKRLIEFLAKRFEAKLRDF